MPKPPDDVQRGVALALEGRRRGMLSDDTLALVFAYYDNEGAQAPMPAGQVLTRLGGLSPNQLTELMGIKAPEAQSEALELSERLTLHDRLGAGAMGAVFRGYDKVLKRVVAVKLIQLARDPSTAATQRARFRREATAMARVRHPACVGIHDAGETPSGEPYLVMEFVEGRSLEQVLDKEPLDPRRVVTWGRALAEGLQACHQVGIVHRDVKPANVLIDGKDRARLTDFGVVADAQADLKLTAERVAVGTLHYIPPEQAIGHPADARSDVYSLGATLYHLLTGHTLFTGDTALEFLQQIAEATPRSPRSLRSELSQDLEAVLVRSLEKDPRARYPSARAFADDLGRVLDGEPVHARPPTGMERLGRSLKRRAGLVAAAAVCGVAVVGTAAWLGSTGLELQRRQEALSAGLEADGRVDALLERLTAAPDPDAEAERTALTETGAALRQEAEALAALGEVHPALGELALLEAVAWRAAGELPRAVAACARARVAPEVGGRSWLVEARVQADQLARLLPASDAPFALEPVRAAVQACYAEAREQRELLDPVDAGWEALAAEAPARALTLVADARTTHDVALLRAVATLRQEPLDLAAVQRHLGHALTLRPRSPQALYVRAVLKTTALADLSGARSDLDAVIALRPGHGPALSQRAAVRFKAGDAAGAREDAEAAITAFPQLALPYELRSGLRALAGDLDGARTDVDLALERNPGSVMAYRNRGRIKELEGDLDGALADYDEALTRDPEFAEGYRARGLLHQQRGQGDAALEDFDRAVSLQPGSAALLNHRGTAHLSLGQVNAAIQDFCRALRIDAELTAARFNLGLARLRQKDFEGARDEFEAVLKLEPGLAPALVNRGICHKAAGDRAAARADFDAAVQRDPDSAIAYYQRAVLALDAKDEAAAAEDFEQVLRIQPQHGEAAALRAFVLKALGRKARY